QGLSLNIIIIAVIALLVLVVIVFIFTGKSRMFTKGVASCESKGGTPIDAADCQGMGPLVGYCEKDVDCDGNKNGIPNEGGSPPSGDGTICCLKLT
ncbi:hypothetical protein KY345_06100, partial [Candidatus Woesearchaeota archaeon]|nr:hypothetical protein [Candidatus Woesearchaeota archaeon]